MLEQEKNKAHTQKQEEENFRIKLFQLCNQHLTKHIPKKVMHASQHDEQPFTSTIEIYSSFATRLKDSRVHMHV